MTHDETQPKPTLNPRQHSALSALLSGSTVTEAADHVGVTRQTVSEWCHHDDLFSDELATRRAELWESIRTRFEQATAKAVDVLTELLNHDDPRIRLGAASRIVGAIAEHRPSDPPEGDRPGGVLVVPGVLTPEDWRAVYDRGPDSLRERKAPA